MKLVAGGMDGVKMFLLQITLRPTKDSQRGWDTQLLDDEWPILWLSVSIFLQLLCHLFKKSVYTVTRVAEQRPRRALQIIWVPLFSGYPTCQDQGPTLKSWYSLVLLGWSSYPAALIHIRWTPFIMEETDFCSYKERHEIWIMCLFLKRFFYSF